MKSGKGNQEYEEYEEDDFNPKRDGPSSNTSNTNATGNTKDKNSDKANAIRSKHSVTEQRRRSKINERFQILRDLIPHSEQKRDTASFLLEVIDYVKYLQEKVQKYEGSYPGWNSEPAKLMPWRNSHWRVQSFVGQPHAAKNGSAPVSMFPGKFEDNNVGITSNMLASTQNTLELEAGREVINKSVDQPMPTPVRTDGTADHPLQRPAGSDLQSVAGPFTENLLNQSEDLSIEGGTINISSVYSQGLLNTLTDALQNAGLDLSQARISVQIDLGKRANRGQMVGTSMAADQDGPISGNSVLADIRDAADGEEGSGQAQKRQKT
ncbi:hypothetical protein CRG98_017114 [Punica granatum]|uniref:BHLH domain-containing protein n=1 Tax=Punica granatum TaxID=22663 RepID=A0A2I0K2X7_PUNGR|nr:hypothetical protein CRG98_017114 [Punica granatum]